jgi:hypothetical protein
MTRQLTELNRQRPRQYYFPLSRTLPNRKTLCQGFDKRHAKRPNIGGGRDVSPYHLGCVIGARLSRTVPELLHRVDPVSRDLELVLDAEDVCGFNVTMHEALAMNIGKRIQNRLQHLACFDWR